MAQAELHFLRARLLGGKRNKAEKGELHCNYSGAIPINSGHRPS